MFLKDPLRKLIYLFACPFQYLLIINIMLNIQWKKWSFYLFIIYINYGKTIIAVFSFPVGLVDMYNYCYTRSIKVFELILIYVCYSWILELQKKYASCPKMNRVSLLSRMLNSDNAWRRHLPDYVRLLSHQASHRPASWPPQSSLSSWPICDWDIPGKWDCMVVFNYQNLCVSTTRALCFPTSLGASTYSETPYIEMAAFNYKCYHYYYFVEAGRH